MITTMSIVFQELSQTVFNPEYNKSEEYFRSLEA